MRLKNTRPLADLRNFFRFVVLRQGSQKLSHVYEVLDFKPLAGVSLDGIGTGISMAGDPSFFNSRTCMRMTIVTSPTG